MAQIITPPANRGLNSQTSFDKENSPQERFSVGLDWIQGTIPISSHEDVISFVEFVEMVLLDVLVLEIGVRTKRGRIWCNSALGAAGSKLAWNLPDEMDDKGTLWFSFGASVLSRCGNAKSKLLLVKALRGYKAKFTRLDIAIDDHEKRLDFDTIWDTLKAGNFSGFREWDPKPPGSKPGWTIYLGSREAEKFYRIYDKFHESRGKIDSIRFEAEFHEVTADTLATEICNLDLSQPDWSIAWQLARYAIGGINFIIKSSKNLSRCKIVSWWADFIESFIGGIKLRVERTKSTLESKMQWALKSVSPSLAVFIKVLGKSFIDFLISEGESNLSPRHHALIKVASHDKKVLQIS